MKCSLSRRDMLKTSAGLAAACIVPKGAIATVEPKPGSRMSFGLVTYLWGQDWDLDTLLINCEKSGIRGVELRTTHAHGVEPSLDAMERSEVKKRFEDSPITIVGPGSNESFHHTDKGKLDAAVEATKGFLKLSHDIGGTGVKVKPDNLPKSVSREKTIEQIGKSLKTLGAFGADYGQEVRLEVHGQCARLPIIKQIMDIADHPSVGVCWNCNDEDLEGEGLEHNFNLVKYRFGATAHVREMNIGNYPYQELMNLFVEGDYLGWILLEARTNPKDRVKALIEQREIWERMIANAQKTLLG